MERDILRDGAAVRIDGWIGTALDACLQNGDFTDK